MNTKLVSFRSYAKQRGISVSYVSRLVKQEKIPTHDGQINPIEADEARGRTTLVGRGQRRWERRHGADVARCVGCGAMFPTASARENGSPDPQHFCEDRCAADVAAVNVARRNSGVAPGSGRWTTVLLERNWAAMVSVRGSRTTTHGTRATGARSNGLAPLDRFFCLATWWVHQTI